MTATGGQFGVNTARWFATVIEPRIPSAKWFARRIRRQMATIHEFERSLLERAPESEWLSVHESRRFSQNGEDGILAGINRALGLSNGYLVEIGSSDGSENCTRALVEDGWRGLWMEGDPERARQAREHVGARPVTVASGFVTRDNIVSLFEEHEVPEEFDLLVVDIDGNDWWVLQQILNTHRPSVVALEYNAAMAHRRWVMPYDAQHEWQHDRWHGASLRSFTELLAQYDMALIGTDSTGVNAFYVRNEHASLFPHPGDVRTHYTPPRHLPPFGHPWRNDETEYPPIDEEQTQRISVVDAELLGASAAAGYLDAIVYVHNGSNVAIGSSGSHPVHVAAWLGTERPEGEPQRFRLLWPIPPGKTRPTFVRLPADGDVGGLGIELVQEGVRWFNRSTT